MAIGPIVLPVPATNIQATSAGQLRAVTAIPTSATAVIATPANRARCGPSRSETSPAGIENRTDAAKKAEIANPSWNSSRPRSARTRTANPATSRAGSDPTVDAVIAVATVRDRPGGDGVGSRGTTRIVGRWRAGEAV